MYLPGLKTFDLDHLVEESIELLREMEPDGVPYYGCFSGGKDSVVIKELARLSGVAIEWHYNVTTIDPPELVRFIRREHPDVAFDRPEKPFFQRMVEVGYPTRRARWCCQEFKESRSPKGAVLVMGIRGAESKRRAARWQDVTFHRRTGAYAVLPILRWRLDHVWEFIRGRGLPYCRLYDEGFERLGCIGCPMARGGRAKQFRRWPQYEKLWRQAFGRLWDKRGWTDYHDCASAEELFDWWMSDDSFPSGDDCQQEDLFS